MKEFLNSKRFIVLLLLCVSALFVSYVSNSWEREQNMQSLVDFYKKEAIQCLGYDPFDKMIRDLRK